MGVESVKPPRGCDVVEGAERPKKATGLIGQRERAGGSAALGLRDSPSSFSSGLLLLRTTGLPSPGRSSPTHIQINWRVRAWGDGSGLTSAGCTFRGYMFDSQHQHMWQLTTTCIYSPRGSDTCFWPVWAPASTWCTGIQTKHSLNINEKGERKDCELNLSKAVSEALTK